MAIDSKELDSAATSINQHTKSATQGTVAVVAVQISVVLNLGFDPGEVITEARLLKAIEENTAQQLQDSLPDLLDHASLIELRDE